MHIFRLTSPNVTVIDPQGRDIEHVAIYDESKFTDYLLSATLTGKGENADKLKKLIYLFLNLWGDGERRIAITCGETTLSVLAVEFIKPEPGQIQLGEPPVDPEREVYAAIEKLQDSMKHKSPNVTALYQQLQDTLKKYPTLQIKEQA